MNIPSSEANKMKKTILTALCAASMSFAALLTAQEPAANVAIIDDIKGP